GSNDGMLHGYRSGANDASGNYSTAATPNDGQEVIAYLLDVTNPANFAESNAASLVVKEISSATLSCVNKSSCG
ncbi:hypothetical protein, partial [Chromobacterium subtsugae]|uniref:hypothetical protein n=1 Tax=Chromobacterium subtsugae TaxID=251747 RepID=UPI0015E7C3A9